MQIGELVAVLFERSADLSAHLPVRVHVKQDGACVPYERSRPARDHDSADETGERVHENPAERPGQHQTDNDRNGDGGVGDDMDERGTHVVVALHRPVRVCVFLERDGMRLAVEDHVGSEFVRLGDFVYRLEESAAIHEGEILPSAIGA